MPSHIKTYDGSEDPEDHLKIFQAAAKTERWAVPTWCHMFNSALIENTRVWFDDLPKESIDSYNDLKKAFLENYLKQKKCIKDPVEIHNIKQRNGESTKEFVRRYKLECRDVKGAPECMKISGFMHEITNPELIKRLHDKIPQSMDEMISVTAAFLRGEMAASNGNRRSRVKEKQRERSGKENKEGETSEKDKPLAILMVQPWQRIARQRITQTFSSGSVISFPSLGEEDRTEEILYEHCFSKFRPKIKNQLIPANTPLVGFSGEIIWHLGQISLLVRIGDEEHSTSARMNFMVVRSPSPYNEIIGRPGVRKIRTIPSTAHGMIKFPMAGGIVTLQSSMIIPLECSMVSEPKVSRPSINQVKEEKIQVAIHPKYPEQPVAIGSTLTEEGRKELCRLLRRHLDVFTWKPADMTGVPRHIAEHRLNVREGCLPVRQKKKGQAPERNKAISKEVRKLVEASILKEVHYYSWLSNPVMRLVDKAFQKQIGRNLKVYVDALVIKSRTEEEVIRDAEEAFKTLRMIIMKLNPKKCAFGMRKCTFLGYKMDVDGLRVSPDKVKAVIDLPSPKCLKDVQKLNGKLASLNIFLSKSAEKSLPFFKTLKKCTKKSDFQWTLEAEEAFKEMRQSIAELPMLMAPKEKEELSIYMAAAKEAISAVLMTERDGKQMPIYFVSRALQGPEFNYTPMEKLILALRPEDGTPDTPMEDREELPDPWILFTDGSSCVDGSGAGLIIMNPEGMKFTYAPRFRFNATNNEAKYEALIAGLRISSQMGIQNLQANMDSKLVANQVNGIYIAKEPSLVRYLEKVKNLASTFKGFFIKQIPRGENKKANALSKIASTSFAHLSKQVLVEELREKAIDEKEILGKARTVRRKAGRYVVISEVLYKKYFLGPWLRCVGPLQAYYVLREIHEGSCSMHAGPRSVVEKALRLGYFWPTMHTDARNLIRKCKDCQKPRRRDQGTSGGKNKNWVEEVSHVLWAHRTMIKSSNEETPFSLTYGTKAVIPAEIGMPTLRTSEVDVAKNNEALGISLDLLEEKREQAAIQEARSKAKMKAYYNARVRSTSFRPGDLVYLNNEASHAEDGGKLGPKWERPYEVTEALGKGAYKLKDRNGHTLSRTWNIRNLKKCYIHEM
uniref:Reverse transcriptase domain-containing protein n=1 Tax=Tanacetum cinerariifolium TaxID=118510 RepID=A0A6L2NQN9_TANCI|nr:reverse transcriptase domain-containing protein [Tanacetum cinerariifolium]